MRKLSSEGLGHTPVITQPGSGREAMEHKVPSIPEPNNLPLWVNTRHPGLLYCESVWPNLLWFEDLCHPHCAVLMQPNHGSEEKGGAVLYSLCNQLMMKSNFMTQNRLKLLALHNFPHRKHTRFLVTFRVFHGWHRTYPKIGLSPRRDLQPKNVTPSPFLNIHHCPGGQPFLPNLAAA